MKSAWEYIHVCLIQYIPTYMKVTTPRTPQNMCKYYHLEVEIQILHQVLLFADLLEFSMKLSKSPSYRSRYTWKESEWIPDIWISTAFFCWWIHEESKMNLHSELVVNRHFHLHSLCTSATIQTLSFLTLSLITVSIFSIWLCMYSQTQFLHNRSAAEFSILFFFLNCYSYDGTQTWRAL